MICSRMLFGFMHNNPQHRTVQHFIGSSADDKLIVQVIYDNLFLVIIRWLCIWKIYRNRMDLLVTAVLTGSPDDVTAHTAMLLTRWSVV